MQQFALQTVQIQKVTPRNFFSIANGSNTEINIKETLFNLQINNYILFNLRTVSNMTNLSR